MGKLKNMIENLRAQYQEKEKPEKNYVPKSVRAKKTGVVLFWALMILNVWLLIGFAAGDSEADSTVQEEAPLNPAIATEGVEFGKLFAKEYFTWSATTEGWLARSERIGPLMAAGLDDQAGIMVSGQTWSSKAGGIRTVDVEETGEDKAMITYEVVQVLAKEDEKSVTVKNLFTVPVKYQSGYAVYDLPSFTAVDTAHAVEAETLKGDSISADERENLKNFLATFFESYATDKPDSLSYLLEGEAVRGLENTLVFEEVREVQAVAGAAAGEYKVEALVILKEPTTESRYTANYHLVVAEKDGRYVVKTINKGGN